LEKLKSQPNRKSSVDEMTVRKTKSADNGEESGSSERTQKVMLNLIVRADVLGSLEAILGMMEKIDSPYVGVKIVSKGLGYITESDILNADATGAMLIAFNVKPSTAASVLARDKGVDVFQYNVIYKLFEEVVEKLRVLIPAELIYTELGSISILAVFQKSPKGMIVGGQVNKGRVELGATARVMREDKIIAEGKIGSLQEGKMDVKFVEQGNQCGMEFVGKAKIEVGDILEIYKEEEHARVLNVAGAK